MTRCQCPHVAGTRTETEDRPEDTRILQLEGEVFNEEVAEEPAVYSEDFVLLKRGPDMQADQHLYSCQLRFSEPHKMG